MLEIAQIPAIGNDVIFLHETEDSKTTRLRVCDVAFAVHKGESDYEAIITLEEIPAAPK